MTTKTVKSQLVDVGESHPNVGMGPTTLVEGDSTDGLGKRRVLKVEELPGYEGLTKVEHPDGPKDHGLHQGTQMVAEGGINAGPMYSDNPDPEQDGARDVWLPMDVKEAKPEGSTKSLEATVKAAEKDEVKQAQEKAEADKAASAPHVGTAATTPATPAVTKA